MSTELSTESFSESSSNDIALHHPLVCPSLQAMCCNVSSSFGALDNYASLVSRAEQPPFWRVVIQSNQAYSCVFLNGIKLKKYFAWCQNRDKQSRMDLTGVQSPQMDWDAENLPERWKRFRQHVELMFSGPLAAKKEEEKCSYLLIWCGEKGRDIANTWSDVSDDDKKKLKTYFERFANHVEPKCNPVFSRYKFHKRVQAESETVEQFVTDLKLLVRDCCFKEPDEMIRDRIVFGTNSRKIREKLINEGKELTLDKAIDIARTYEMSQSQMKSMEAGDEAVHSVNRD